MAAIIDADTIVGVVLVGVVTINILVRPPLSREEPLLVARSVSSPPAALAAFALSRVSWPPRPTRATKRCFSGYPHGYWAGVDEGRDWIEATDRRVYSTRVVGVWYLGAVLAIEITFHSTRLASSPSCPNPRKH